MCRRSVISRALGAATGIGLRAAMVAMLHQVLRAGPQDHRFAAKGIGSRALVVVPATAVALPAAWLRRRGRPYPVWMDDLLLSIVALDLAGNVFDLYDRHSHFDLLAHAHGTGALMVLLAGLLRLPITTAAGLATVGHALLEAQEAVSDALFGYRNVRGPWDTIGDLAAGAIGSVAYGAVYARLACEPAERRPRP